jgi:formate-dependent nitrite reductase cytochrome c552 subunit
MPEEKIERDPWLKRMFLGYAFSIDYRDRRGHAYMLADQEATQRLTKPQSGSCLHCHASMMPLYRHTSGAAIVLVGQRVAVAISNAELANKPGARSRSTSIAGRLCRAITQCTAITVALKPMVHPSQ